MAHSYINNNALVIFIIYLAAHNLSVSVVAQANRS